MNHSRFDSFPPIYRDSTAASCLPTSLRMARSYIEGPEEGGRKGIPADLKKKRISGVVKVLFV